MSKKQKQKDPSAKETVCMWIFVAFLIYVFASGIATCVGIMDAGDHGALFETRCNKPAIKAEYVFPAYRLGCWLGGEVK